MGHVGTGLVAPVRGAILAGGRAARFDGASKGLYAVGAHRMIDVVHAALKPNCDDIAIISGHRDAVRWLPAVRILPDILDGGGSAVGIHAALQQMASPLIVVAWDMPFVTPELIALLAARGEAGGTAHDAVVIEGGKPGSVEPLCAWYTPPMADAIERGHARGDRSLHHALAALRVTVIARAELAEMGGAERLLRNVNTPTELMRAQMEVAP